MAGQRTNVALAVTIAVAAASGLLALSVGTPIGAVPVWLHGAAGLAVVLLAPTKMAVARRGMRRSRPGRIESLSLAGLIAVTIVSGVLHSWFAVRSLGPLTTMQVHIGSALISLLLVASHYRRRPRQRIDVDRRTVVRTLGLTAGAAALAASSQAALALLGLPGADRRFTGSHEVGSGTPALMPTTQWFTDTAPLLDPRAFELQVDTGTDRRSYSLDQLSVWDESVVATLDCTSGWHSTQTWKGVPLSQLIDSRAGESIEVLSATGYARRFPAHGVDELLLAHSVGGEPLSVGHGAPLRLVAPGRRGFWWVKWVAGIRVDDRPWWLQSPFPLS